MQYCVKKNSLWYLCRLLLLIAGCMMMWTTATVRAAGFAERVSSMSEIKAVRVSTTSDKTRIVVDTGKESTYKVSVLSNPQRIVVDIQNAWLNPDVKKSTAIDSRFAKTVRIAQHDKSTVRVVVESTMGKNNYKVFALQGGGSAYRLVLDFGNLGNSSKNSGIDFNPQPKADAGSSESIAKDSDISYDNSQDSSSFTADSAKSDQEPGFTPGLKGKIIALDAGHGGSDVGAIGPTGVTEKGVTMRVAKALQKLLASEGATVLMTRDTDTEVSVKKANASDVEELQARCDVGNNGNADIFVSMHMDSFTSSEPSGTTGYYYSKGSKASRLLAKYVSEGVVAELGIVNRGTKSCNFYVVKHTDMPATLVEMAFISNKKEEKLMNSEEGISKAAEGIFNGLRKFFG